MVVCQVASPVTVCQSVELVSVAVLRLIEINLRSNTRVSS
eukprot:COSAG02_NODE_28524_length_588_cov_0.572597_1_plen_39_part_10